MKAVIRFTRPDNKLAILTEFLDIIQSVNQLRQHVLTHGILFEPLGKNEIEVLKNALIKLKYFEYTTTDHSLRLMIEKEELHCLLKLVITLPFMRNEFAEMFWEKGFVIDNVTPDQAIDLQDRLEAIATVTITPDIADTPEPVVYTVSGQVRKQDGLPLTESGFTVHVFDSVSPNNLVRLGSVDLNSQSSYHLSYSWKSDGRNGPDLIVRLVDSDGKTISEARRQFATRNEIVNLTVEDSEKRTVTIKGRVERQTQDAASPASSDNLSGLLIEARDKYEILSEPLGKGATDQEGRFTITLNERQVRELFVGRRPDVFFTVSTGEEVLLDTRNSVIHNIAEVTREMVLLIPATQTHPGLIPQPSHPAVMGTAVLSPGWEKDILIEVFADPELRQPLGMAKVGASGRFEIPLASAAERLWFRWSEGKKQGQSPILQPFDAADLIRLHIVERYPAIPIDKEMGEGRYEGMVRSITGRPVIGTGVYLIEIALRRCQVLGNAVTDHTGVYRILYNARKLLAGKPDLRVIVFGNDGIPLMESENSTVILPGRVAGTYSLHNRVGDALRNEGILGAEDFQLTPGDIDYIASRTDLPQKAVAAYAAASNLAHQLKIPQTALFAMLNSDNALDPKAALEQAVEQDDVSPSALRGLPEITSAIMSAAQDRILTKNLGRGSIDDFLSLRVSDPATRKEVAKLMLDAPTGVELRAKLKEQGILNPGLDFLLVIQSLTGVDCMSSNQFGLMVA